MHFWNDFLLVEYSRGALGDAQKGVLAEQSLTRIQIHLAHLALEGLRDTQTKLWISRICYERTR